MVEGSGQVLRPGRLGVTVFPSTLVGGSVGTKQVPGSNSAVNIRGVTSDEWEGLWRCGWEKGPVFLDAGCLSHSLVCQGGLELCTVDTRQAAEGGVDLARRCHQKLT